MRAEPRICPSCRAAAARPADGTQNPNYCAACGWLLLADGSRAPIDTAAALCVEMGKRAGDLDYLSPGDNRYIEKRDRLLDEIVLSAATALGLDKEQRSER
jgi:hypothetical protein